MNIFKDWIKKKSVETPAAKPSVETEEVPTMILDDAPFRTYRLLRKVSDTTHQAKPPAYHMLATR